MGVIYDRIWCMANPDTFSMKPIDALLHRYIPQGPNAKQPTLLVIDPFARNNKWGNCTNDLNPAASADYHMDAVEFLDLIVAEVNAGTRPKFDVALLDPPYSPRQISECYQSIGKKATGKDTQNARLYKECKDRLDQVLKVGGLAVCFGWNSAGFGLKRGYELNEILLVPHGAAHNDTIVTVETKVR